MLELKHRESQIFMCDCGKVFEAIITFSDADTERCFRIIPRCFECCTKED